MSQSREFEEDADMTISYTTQPSTGHPHQTLPSFRELLPPHLHDEIESTPYQPQQVRPHSAHDMADPRSIPYPQPSTPYESHREYTVTREHQQPRMSDPALPMRLSDSRSRGPSPILPPIRNLDSIPGRSMNTPPPMEHVPRSDPFAQQDYREPGPAHEPREYAQPMQSPYGHAYAQEQMSPMMSGGASGQGQANFGVMGEPSDPTTRRRRGNLPKPVTDILRAWFHEHLAHPYPSEEDKQMFMTRTGLTISQELWNGRVANWMQISNWFINARRRQLPALLNQRRPGADEAEAEAEAEADDSAQVASHSSEHVAAPHS
ncbi:Homeobox transcription factor [Penicillium sp. DV-2018c]|nr:Homeobox transcription factor [Penicillium sp. DV-2018c]KAJ5583585.1 Homeobox transcription factor [Penicillium sp. DV-2018c]